MEYSPSCESIVRLFFTRSLTIFKSAVIRGDVTLIDFFIATEADKDALYLAHRFAFFPYIVR